MIVVGIVVGSIAGTPWVAVHSRPRRSSASARTGCARSPGRCATRSRRRRAACGSRSACSRRSPRSLPPGRVHAVEVSQSILWRPAGWWTITRQPAVGARALTDGDADQFATVLPVGTRDDVERVLRLLLPDLPDERVAARVRARPARPEAATTRTRTPRAARACCARCRGSATASCSPDALLLRRGAIWRKLAIFPLARLQSIAHRAGPDRSRAVGREHPRPHHRGPRLRRSGDPRSGCRARRVRGVEAAPSRASRPQPPSGDGRGPAAAPRPGSGLVGSQSRPGSRACRARHPGPEIRDEARRTPRRRDHRRRPRRPRHRCRARRVPVTRSSASPRDPTRSAPRPCFPASRCSTPLEVVRRSELVVIAVPHDELPGLVAGLAELGAWQPGQLVAAHRSRATAPRCSRPPRRRARSRSPCTRRSPSPARRWTSVSSPTRTPPSPRRRRCCRSRRRSPSSSAASRSSSPRSRPPRVRRGDRDRDRVLARRSCASRRSCSRRRASPFPGRLPVGPRALDGRSRAVGCRRGPAKAAPRSPLRSTDDQHHGRAWHPTGRAPGAAAGDGADARSMLRASAPIVARSGHIDLIHRREGAAPTSSSCRSVVNRLRFRTPAEFDAYPRTPDDDRCALLESLGVDVIFAPDRRGAAAGSEPATTKIERRRLGLRYEGRSAPGYFDGLLTTEAQAAHTSCAPTSWSTVSATSAADASLVRRLDDPRWLRDFDDRASRQSSTGARRRRGLPISDTASSMLAGSATLRRGGETARGDSSDRGIQRRPAASTRCIAAAQSSLMGEPRINLRIPSAGRPSRHVLPVQRSARGRCARDSIGRRSRSAGRRFVDYATGQRSASRPSAVRASDGTA